MIEFDLIIVLLYVRLYLYLFQVNCLLVFAGLFFFFLLFIFIFRVIHNPAHWRNCLSCNLNKIKPKLFCLLQCILGTHNAHLFAVRADKPYFFHAYSLIDSQIF